ncbi:hypothetical protein Acsp04_15100 [Actinomadura sp. NBRC 104425]|nr:hypothetical protein Acsp04_15100 [Actinomadura sp. NBRC 104425]
MRGGRPPGFDELAVRHQATVHIAAINERLWPTLKHALAAPPANDLLVSRGRRVRRGSRHLLRLPDSHADTPPAETSMVVPGCVAEDGRTVERDGRCRRGVKNGDGAKSGRWRAEKSGGVVMTALCSPRPR